MASRPFAHGLSLALHAAVFVYLAFAPPHQRERPYSVYREQIFPNQKKLIWYSFKTKLPEVSPLERRGPSRKPRVDVKSPQIVIAQAPRSPRAKQMIWQPVPRIELKQDLKSPNLLAFEVQVPPAPRPRPQPRRFVPPPEPKPPTSRNPALPAAPQLEARAETAARPIAQPRPDPKRFTLPMPDRPPTKPNPALPVAPQLAIQAEINARSIVQPRPDPKRLALPTPVERSEPSLALPPPPSAIPAGQSESSLVTAIVGLQPSATLDVPPPEASRQAQFSAGPEVDRKATGGAEPVSGARILVPDLMVRGGNPERPASNRPLLIARAAPTSAENLRAALHAAPSAPAPAPANSIPQATLAATAPDPRMAGRAVYTLSIQMPNVTSYIGSWILWFAERTHAAIPGAIRPPVPLRKVDPKYLPAAMAERIEGKVQLTAVIRRDGRVEEVTLLKKLDPRLDQTAAEALQKWQFEPALRDGVPIEVDAVVEIPFRLAPKSR